MSRHEYFALPYRGAWTWTTTYVRTYAWVGWQVYCCCGVARGETRRGGCGCACSADARDAMPVARSHQSIPSSRPRQKTATHRRLCFFSIFRTLSPTTESLTSPHLTKKATSLAAQVLLHSRTGQRQAVRHTSSQSGHAQTPNVRTYGYILTRHA